MIRNEASGRRILTIAALLTGFLGGLSGCEAPVEEAVELLSEDGEKILREPMRAPRSGPRVLVFALDGVGENELLEAIESGRMPNVGALLGPQTGEPGLYATAVAVPNVLSVLPSTTLAAWTSLFTGEPASRTGVPGNEWFVREENRFYAPAPVTVTEPDHALQIYTDDLLGASIRVPTLYERADVRAYVSLSQVHRGADLLTMPGLDALGELVTAVAEGLVGDTDVEQATYADLDVTAVQSLVESLRSHGVPDLQVVYFPGVDLYTHVASGGLDDQLDYIQGVFDDAFAQIVGEYDAQGALADTYILFVSDHGHTPVLNDDRHALEAEGDDEPPAVLEAAGFRVRPPVLEPDEEDLDYQAVLAYQGAFAYVYLADRSSCPELGDLCDWNRPPRLEADVLQAVAAFDAANRTGEGVPELQGTIDLIFARDPRPTGQDALPFQVWDGRDLITISEYLAENPRPDLLDLETRLAALAAGPYGHRAGDVLLLARSSETEISDRYYFSGPYHSWHGSPTAQDSRIPLLVARSSRTGAALTEEVRSIVGAAPDQLAITPLILGLLARTEEP